MGNETSRPSADGFEIVIGLEIHIQLNTRTKLFCGCPIAAPQAKPNTSICPVCTGQPGTLPVLNGAAVGLAAKAALCLGCALQLRSVFARKNYFYPDLPKGYQISQYELPLALKGRLAIELEDGEKTIGITRVHMEEDAGKLLHAVGSAELDHSLVDFNRCGVPLIEIVSEPDMRSPEEAYAYVTALKAAMQWAGVSNCDMENGELRVDVNVSLRPAGREKFGTKVEIKNLNSFKSVKDALRHEIIRQAEELKAGRAIMQETRLWDGEKTAGMRSKEEAHDYRYFPDPDLPPLNLDPVWIESLKASLPELPAARKARFSDEYGLSAYDASVMAGTPELADYFESAARLKIVSPKKAANWIAGELLAKLNAEKKTAAQSPVSPQNLVELALLVETGKISGKSAKEVFAEMWNTGKSASAVASGLGLSQVNDEAQLETWAKEAIAENPKACRDVRAGNEKAVCALVGAVMKKSKGKANPGLLNSILNNLLKNAAR